MPHLHALYDFVVSVFIVHRRVLPKSGLEQHRVLLVHHKRYQEWLPIGGHIELNEDPEEALYREVREECGLKVRLLADTPPISHPGVKPLPTPAFVDVHRISATHRHIAFIYLAMSKQDTVVLHTREHDAFCWLDSRALGDGRFKLSRSIRFYSAEALAKARTV